MSEHETPRASSRETAPTRAEFENALRVFANNQFASGLAQGNDRVCNNDAVAAKDVLVALWDRLAASRAPAETSAPPKRCYYCEDAATQRVDDDWIWVCDQHATETTAPHVYDDGEEAGESEELVERARAASDAGQRGGDPPPTPAFAHTETPYRWNAEREVWEFYQPEWGGWCVLPVEPFGKSRPMSFTEGIRQLALYPLVRGHEPETGWLRDRIASLDLGYKSAPAAVVAPVEPASEAVERLRRVLRAQWGPRSPSFEKVFDDSLTSLIAASREAGRRERDLEVEHIHQNAANWRNEAIEDAKVAREDARAWKAVHELGVGHMETFAKRIERLEAELATARAAAEQAGPLNRLAAEVHAAQQKWWQVPRNKGERLMLVVTEIAEAFEGERKSLMDDKLPHRRMAEVELADTIIRILDYCGAYGYDLDGAYREKMAFNAQREDHKREAASINAGGNPLDAARGAPHAGGSAE